MSVISLHRVILLADYLIVYTLSVVQSCVCLVVVFLPSQADEKGQLQTRRVFFFFLLLAGRELLIILRHSNLVVVVVLRHLDNAPIASLAFR